LAASPVRETADSRRPSTTADRIESDRAAQ
jgi:hypothetical protein